MRWKSKGIKIILSLRVLIKTKGRWDQFWEKLIFLVFHLWVDE